MTKLNKNIFSAYKIQESSFRDPGGFLFYDDTKLLRQINLCYKEDYDFLCKSGLYEKLGKKGFLIKHKELDDHHGMTDSAYKIIEPEKISFISYPYEWCFSQLKDAAITTLKIQKTALQNGMTLKDASAYNIQFQHGKPVFIDTLSFEKYIENKPWAAYKQFCQHFLAPLALMTYTDIRLNQLMKIYLDGIPLDLAVKLLPIKTKFKFSLLMHLHMHAKAQKKYQHKGGSAKNIKITKARQLAVIQSLMSAIKKLRIKAQFTEWGDYYNFTNYTNKAFTSKKEIITDYIKSIKPKAVWDLGANTGEFTRIAGELGAKCVAFDIDPLAVESGYNNVKKRKIKNILPLILDLTNPSPPIGWNNEERTGIKSRPLPDAVFALALIHHLAISNNLPFQKIASFLGELSDNLIIEFVPKSDSQVQKLLESRKDIFGNYNIGAFVKEFEKVFIIKEQKRVADSERVIFWMQKR